MPVHGKLNIFGTQKRLKRLSDECAELIQEIDRHIQVGGRHIDAFRLIKQDAARAGLALMNAEDICCKVRVGSLKG